MNDKRGMLDQNTVSQPPLFVIFSDTFHYSLYYVNGFLFRKPVKFIPNLRHATNARCQRQTQKFEITVSTIITAPRYSNSHYVG